MLSFPSHGQYEDDFYASLREGTRFQTCVAATTTAAVVVAYALIDLVTDPIRLRSMAVHPHYRRRGLGEALLRHVVASTRGKIDLFR